MGKKSRLKKARRELVELGVPSNTFKAFPDTQVRHNPPGSKLSVAIAELVDPYMEEIENLDQFKDLVALAVVGWNLSLMENPSPEEKSELFRDFDHPFQEVFEWIVSEFAKRKRSLFPKDNRAIVGWEATVQPNGTYYLKVASSWVE